MKNLLVNIRLTGRIVLACFAAVFAVLLLVLTAVLPLPEHRVEPVAVTVQPAANSQQRVCPGPLLSPADNAAQATTISSFVNAPFVSTSVPADAAIVKEKLAANENPNSGRDGSPFVTSADAGMVGPGMIAAAQSALATTESVAGLAVTGCTEPANESWIAAGSTVVGRNSLLLLTNPSEISAETDIRVITESGAVNAPAGLGVIVPAKSQKVISIAGLAPNAASPVIHVTSSGAAIAVHLEQTVIDGLSADGVELTETTTMPATEQVIPGVAVPQAAGTNVGEEANGDWAPIVRLFAPDGAPANVSIAVTADGGGDPAVIQAQLHAGQVSDIPLGRLAAGGYTIRLTSDIPIVAAARTVTGVEGQLPGDFAWFAAARPLLDSVVIAIPEGPAPVLRIVSRNGSIIPGGEIRAEGEGVPERVQLRGGVFAALPLKGSVIKLTGTQGMVASVSYSDSRQLSAFLVRPPGPSDSPLTVYPR